MHDKSAKSWLQPATARHNGPTLHVVEFPKHDEQPQAFSFFIVVIIIFFFAAWRRSAQIRDDFIILFFFSAFSAAAPPLSERGCPLRSFEVTTAFFLVCRR